MKEKDNNIRTCVATKEKLNKNEMLRFAVFEEDGIIVPDFNKKLCSRGVYIKASKTALKTAIDKQLFIRSLRQKVKHEKSLTQVVEEALKKKGLESISLAKKAGGLIIGLDNIKKERDNISFFIDANQESDGYKKIKALAKEKEIFCLYNLEELELALNLSNCAHLGIKNSPISKSVFENLYKLKSFLEN
ncbi:MAG: DUF448 domain-containing protein [Alphaproteobacteria bacterium]